MDTAYGNANIKKAYYKGIFLKSKPEYDDCRRLAEDNNVPIKNVYDEILKNIKAGYANGKYKVFNPY